MSVRTYNPSVRVGNWNEDIQLEEDTLKEFLDRREKGELLIQRTDDLFKYLNKVDLSISRDGFVHFGDIVMVLNPGKSDRIKYTSGSDPRDNSVLSANINREGACGVVGSSQHTDPCRRTAFMIVSIDGTPNESPLVYGQAFHLKALTEKESDFGDLLLFSDRSTFQKSAKKSRHQVVSLVREPSKLTQWRIEYLNPQLRMEYEQIPVPANEKVIIKHCYTNQALAVEQDHKIRTTFGLDYEISGHTFLDSHKAEEDVNHFLVVMGVPGDQVYNVQPDDTQMTQEKTETFLQS